MNPITGKWMTKLDGIDSMLAQANFFYKNIEKKLETLILKPLPIRRYFLSEEDLSRAQRKIKNLKYKDYIKSILKPGSKENGIIDLNGSMLIKEGQWLNVPKYLDESKQYFIRKNQFSKEKFSFKKLIKIGNSSWNYKNIITVNIIFCQGIHIHSNPFFKNFPIKAIRGDILTLKIPELKLPFGLYQKKRWLHSINLSDNIEPIYRFGANYIEQDLKSFSLEKSKASLINILKDITRSPFELISQESGYRPTTENSKPVILRHPKYKSIFAINGLGSRGTLYSPYLARQFDEKYHI